MIATIVIEFWKGARAIHAKESLPMPRAVVELTWRNTRRYGGYLVHMGIVFMFIGFTGNAFNLRQTLSLGLNQSTRFGHYELKLLSVTNGDNSNYESSRAFVDVSRDGHVIDQLTPEIRLYKSSQEQSSIIAIRRRLNEDLYVNFAGISPDNTKAIFQMSILPLVAWVWIGYFVLLGGTIICLIPSKVRLHYARTEIVGFTRATATVQS